VNSISPVLNVEFRVCPENNGFNPLSLHQKDVPPCQERFWVQIEVVKAFFKKFLDDFSQWEKGHKGSGNGFLYWCNSGLQENFRLLPSRCFWFLKVCEFQIRSIMMWFFPIPLVSLKFLNEVFLVLTEENNLNWIFENDPFQRIY